MVIKQSMLLRKKKRKEKKTLVLAFPIPTSTYKKEINVEGSKGQLQEIMLNLD